jgi:hypothetical protein
VDIAKLLGVDINVAELEKAGLAAKQTQAEMLEEIKRMNAKLSIIAHAAEVVVQHLLNKKS